MLEDALYIEETKVTVRKYKHRTTVPAKIFKLLKLKDGDSLRWIPMKDGKILIEKSLQSLKALKKALQTVKFGKWKTRILKLR
ncbi:MAG: putative regulator PrlF [Candidatus Bathyarchaeota archaeon BA2]|nr:MAG: putative regulator PrlF [Candidatus Bathyarchaeota archaeon BA2]